MSSPPESTPVNPLSFNIQTRDNSGTVVGQLIGGTVINIYWSRQTSSPTPSKSEVSQFGENPYKGLWSFQENDSDFFLGRSQEIEDLRQRFCTLYKKKGTVRLLPIYGPSGSGKSSLARAGLVPALARESLLGYGKAKVVVLVPGESPLESLAVVLASIKDAGPSQMEWERQFIKEINERKHDWLRYIAVNKLQDSDKSPLIILIDQFEEVYTQCKDKAERDVFIRNLLSAAENRSTNVFVIITLRVDFLSETQQHPDLNQLIAKQGVFVPVLSKQGLEEAIRKPAELAGSPLDEAIVPLLIQQTEGREGALPLLQFTLTRIWDRRLVGKLPNKTLDDLGGVYKALATEAERVYKDNLTDSQQRIARRVFIGLVQIGEGTRDTRRRVAIDRLMSYQDNSAEVIEVIRQFAAYDVRLIGLSSSQKEPQTSNISHEILSKNWNSLETYAEITHEALLEHWGSLKTWLDKSRNAVITQREIEIDAKQWETYNRSKDYLLYGSKLSKAKDFKNDPKDVSVSKLIAEFIEKSNQHQQRRRNLLVGSVISIIGFISSIACIAVFQWGLAEKRELEILMQASKAQLESGDQLKALLSAVKAGKQSVRFPNSLFIGGLEQDVENSLKKAVEQVKERNRLQLDSTITSVSFSPDDTYIAAGSTDGTINLWKSDGTKHQSENYHVSTNNTVSTTKLGSNNNEQFVLFIDQNSKVRRWWFNKKDQEPDSVASIPDQLKGSRFSPDGKYLVVWSTNREIGIIDMESTNTKQGEFRKIIEPDENLHIYDVNFSPDGQLLIAASRDKEDNEKTLVEIWTVKDLFRQNSTQLSRPVSKKYEDAIKRYVVETSDTSVSYLKEITSIAIRQSEKDGVVIVLGDDQGKIIVWDWSGSRAAACIGIRNKKDCHTDSITDIQFEPDNNNSFATASADGTIKYWQFQKVGLFNPELLMTYKGHAKAVRNISFDKQGGKLISGGADETVRLWQTNDTSFKSDSSFNQLLEQGCDYLKDYFNANPKLLKEDGQLCKGFDQK